MVEAVGSDAACAASCVNAAPWHNFLVYAMLEGFSNQAAAAWDGDVQGQRTRHMHAAATGGSGAGRRQG
jgi:hypothetical protein